MARVLLIDDDASLLDALSMSFEEAGFEVCCAADGKQGLRRIESDHPDAVVCDVNMPGLDGFTLCRKLRERGMTLPFILLTSRDNEIDETLGLDLGADDYITKPFSTRVLLARIRALLRRQEARRQAPERPQALLQRGPLRLDPERMEVRYQDQPLALTLTEFRMLEALVGHAGAVLNRDRLLDLARSDDSAVVDRLVDTYVRRLRRKFEAIDPGFSGIETVHGVGYRWRDSD